MEDQISQSFKVQWINTTLKYLKDDNQLIMKYSDMPVNHMEYLYNLIWERRNGVELGFKSMYAPVWEAMKIFSLKYQFKVSVNKSEDGEKGHLVIEKIPKKDHENMATEQNLEQANEIPDYQSTDSEDSNSESSQSQPDTQMSGARIKKPTKTKKKKTKGQKFCLDKQKIIESISPVLVRKALKNILDFLLKKEEASIIFSDLAPVEAKFLENFLGIYNKRVSFRGSLSPACNLILDKMCEFFKEFDKQCKLEVYAAKYNVHTQKREVTFMKVPRYTKANANQPQKQIVTPQMKAKDIQSVSPFKNDTKTPRPILSQTIVNSNLKITMPNVSIEKSDAIENRGVKLSMNIENREEKLSVNAEIKDKMSMNEGSRKERLTENREETCINVENIGVNAENREQKSKNREEKTSMNSENGEKNLSVNNLNKNNTKAENSDAINKQLKSINETKDNKLTDNVKIIEDKLVVLNKELLKQEIEGIAIPKDAAKTVPEKKMDNPAIALNRMKDRCLGARKEKLLEAMSTPLESDKAMRMMRLMGWQGGALGARGDGIVEPIIPALDIVRGKGLGHVGEKPKPTKSVKSVKPVIPVKNLQVDEKLQKSVNKPQVEEKPAPTKLSVRVENRIHFLKTILDLINKDESIESVTLTYLVHLRKKEKKGFKNIIKNLNRRINHSLTPPENLILKEITRCMDAVPKLALDLIVTEGMKELTITKMVDSIEDFRPHRKRHTLLPETVNEDVTSSRKITKTDFNIYICSIVLEFLKSSDTERWIDFDATLPEKYCDIVEKVCFYVNTKTLIPFKSAGHIAREIMEINEKCYLDVQFDGKPTRSFLLRKFHHRKPCINKEALKNILQRYTKTVLANNGDINEHRGTETVRSNSDIEANKQNTINVMVNEASNIINPYTDKTCERLNPRNNISKQDTSVSYICIDSVRNYVVDDEEIKGNRLKTNEENQCYDNLKFSNHIVNDCKDIEEKTGKTLKRFPLYAKDIITDHNDIRRIDMDLIQVTINSLTTHTENLEDIKIELHDNELHAKVHENNAFNINVSPKCTESSKLSDKQDTSCQLSNMRKWYDHSEKFLRCDLVKYTSPVKTIDSNNNRNEEANIEGFKYIGEKVMNIHFDIAKIENMGKNKDDAMEVVLSNKGDEIQSQMNVKRIEGNDSQDFNPIGAYEGCDGITGSINATEWHQAGEKQSVLVTKQEEANNNEDLKPTNVSDNVIANNTIIDVIESEKALQEFKNHSINKQVSEVSNNIKDPIESKISNQLETHSKLDVIPMYRDNNENLNNISVNEVRANNIKDIDVIESNQSHQDDEKHSELDIIETATQNESFEAVELKQKVCVNQEDDSDKKDLRLTSNFKTVGLGESKNTEEIQSKLDIYYNNSSKHTSENQTKDLKNTNTEINRTYDVVIIKSNILEIEVIQKKIQNTIESIDSEVEFLPLLKYHGIIYKGLVYSCHNKESSIWLRNILPNYSVIDYKSAINNYKLKIKVASLNEDAKKFLELLEKYNLGLKCQDWNIISKKHYIYTLILCVEVDSDSFEYICDKNFSLFVGYDVAQFSIGC